MKKEEYISVLRSDVSQMLDCLERRIMDWSDTAKVLRDEPISRPFFIQEECKDEEEADWVTNNYQAVYDRVDKLL